MEKDWEEFRKEVIKANTHHRHKVTGSLGIRDAFLFMRKNKWLDIGQALTEKQVSVIIKSINLFLRDQLLQGKDIDLPHQMGRIELRKYNVHFKLENGKVKTNLPVDWKSTMQLWHEDEECYKNKTLVRYERQERFTIFYNKIRAKYNNKVFYQLTPHREVKKELSKRITEGTVDAFLLTR